MIRKEEREDAFILSIESTFSLQIDFLGPMLGHMVSVSDLETVFSLKNHELSPKPPSEQACLQIHLQG